MRNLRSNIKQSSFLGSAANIVHFTSYLFTYSKSVADLHLSGLSMLFHSPMPLFPNSPALFSTPSKVLQRASSKPKKNLS